ncbi:MAG: hypothetical protein NT098_05840 [Candidatus Parcubacteria bacterium]|nr:hypothetical protein [Candidatus Parcubacteria bacterium]
MKIRTQLIATYIAIATLPVVVISWTSYTKAHDSLIAVQQNSLESISLLKINSINDYFSFFSKEITITKERFTVRQNFPILAHLTPGINDSEQKKAREAIDLNVKSILSTIKEMDDLFFLDPFGTIIYSSKKDKRGIPN